MFIKEYKENLHGANAPPAPPLLQPKTPKYSNKKSPSSQKFNLTIMYLAYSAISASTHHPQNDHKEAGNELMIRYRAYQTTCDKYNQEIAAIQKYLPGWMPKFR